MDEGQRPLFVGIKISPKLRRELDNGIREAERYLTENQPESLQIVTRGEDKLIGRFLQDGFPVHDLDNVSRNVRSIVSRLTRGGWLAENSVRIRGGAGYADSTISVSLLTKEQTS